MDLLPTLLLPLAGPEEVGGDEVMEKLPEELQYLPDDKQREVEPDIRKMLLEALMQVRQSFHCNIKGYYITLYCTLAHTDTSVNCTGVPLYSL